MDLLPEDILVIDDTALGKITLHYIVNKCSVCDRAGIEHYLFTVTLLNKSFSECWAYSHNLSVCIPAASDLDRITLLHEISRSASDPVWAVSVPREVSDDDATIAPSSQDSLSRSSHGTDIDEVDDLLLLPRRLPPSRPSLRGCTARDAHRTPDRVMVSLSLPRAGGTSRVVVASCLLHRLPFAHPSACSAPPPPPQTVRSAVEHVLAATVARSVALASLRDAVDHALRAVTAAAAPLRVRQRRLAAAATAPVVDGAAAASLCCVNALKRARARRAESDDDGAASPPWFAVATGAPRSGAAERAGDCAADSDAATTSSAASEHDAWAAQLLGVVDTVAPPAPRAGDDGGVHGCPAAAVAGAGGPPSPLHTPPRGMAATPEGGQADSAACVAGPVLAQQRARARTPLATARTLLRE